MTLIPTSAAIIVGLLLLVGPSRAETTVTIALDSAYDNASGTTAQLACHSIPLIRCGDLLSELPSYPFIECSSMVTGWNSAECAMCWNLTYGETTVNVLVVDTAAEGVTLLTAAFYSLTGGAKFVEAQAVQLVRAACSLNLNRDTICPQ